MAPGAGRFRRALALVLVSGWGCSGALGVGDPAPGFLASCGEAASACDGTDPVKVVWVFTTEDCLRCLGFPAVLRDTWRRYGAEAFAFEAVHVRDPGESGEWLPRYFMKERLTPRIHAIDRRRFRREFRSLPLPSLLVIANGVVESISTGEPQALDVLPGLIRLDSASYGR